MKRILMVAGLMVLPLAALAQDLGARTQVPFPFRVGNEVLPAGDYVIRAVPGCQRIRVQERDGRAGLYLTPLIRERAKSEQAGMLVFHRYGNQYFLRNVWMPNRPAGYALPESKAEREMSKLAGPVEVASVRVSR